MYNPDYPVDNGNSFLMHTYQQPQQNNTMYWNGGYGMMGGMQYDMNSRRNFNPVNPFQQYGQVPNVIPQQNVNPFAPQQNNGSIPESMVQPFGTYPPATPNGAQPALNQFIDSRRNNMNPVQVNQNNPWATPQSTQQAQPQQQQMPQFPAYPSSLPANYGWDPYGFNCGFKVDMTTAALYNPQSVPSFDRNNSWDNCYTKYRPLMSPYNIDWRGQNAQYQQNPFSLQAPQPVQQMPQYPVQQYNVPQNWNDAAERNWAQSV